MAIMSDDADTFLARWSKRKAQARAGDIPAESPAPASPLDVAHSTGAGASEVDEVALEDLPAIESIDANTDLTPWLRKKVPEAWKRAALGRVWASDPAISEFVGLADYAWDWNAPDGVPGFGPLRTTDNVAELLAQVIGETPQAKPDAAIAAEPAALPEIGSAPPAVANDEPGEVPGDVAEKISHDLAGTKPPDQIEARGVAAQNSAPEEMQPIRRRRGGGALPS
jgi:hypothetical protein